MIQVRFAHIKVFCLLIRLSVSFAAVVLAGGNLMAQTGGLLAPGCWENKANVTTVYGNVKGVSDKGNTWCWRGIPYAVPPVGALRWKAPVDPAPWTGIRSARKFASPASQLFPRLGPMGSEDCLHLNIWRPKNTETRLPVYVFIHGGGNSIGTGNSGDYYGHAVAGESKMVYVTVNFRLGVMGWFRHPAVTGSGTPEDQSGNFGTLDLIKALQWIHKNIEAFGGDPGNVTIAGESGGAFDVLSLMTSPLASGLFHRAVCESGINMIYSTKQAEEQTLALVKNLLIADRKASDEPAAELVYKGMNAYEIDTYLRSKSPAEIMKRIPVIFGVMAQWRSIYTDGTVLPAKGYQVFSDGTWANKVPLVIGVNKNEATLFNLLLRKDAPGTRDFELMSRYQSLLWRVCGLDTIARAMASNPGSPPVYAYRFEWGSPDNSGFSVLPDELGSKIGASHYAEIPFFLGMRKNQLSLLTGKTFTAKNLPGREKLTRLSLSYLKNFAARGNPNGTGLPLWNPWNPAIGADKYIVLDAGLNDLKISSGSDSLSVKMVIDLIKTELREPEQTNILKKLSSPLPFGLGK